MSSATTDGLSPIDRIRRSKELEEAQKAKKALNERDERDLRASGVPALGALERRRLETELKEQKAELERLRAQNTKLEADVVTAEMKATSLSAVETKAAPAPELTRVQEIELEIEALTSSMASVSMIDPAEAKAAERVHLEADALAKFLSILDPRNPFMFGRVPIAGSKVAATTNADGKGVEAAKFSRHLNLGRALAMTQKFAVWHNEWREICIDLAESNQRIELLESNQKLQLLKRQLQDASRDATRAIADSKRAAAVKIVAATAATPEAKRAGGAGSKRSSAEAKLEESQAAAKRQRYALAAFLALTS